MGQVLQPNRQKRTYKSIRQDRPYLVAISSSTHLDWKKHLHIDNKRESRDQVILKKNLLQVNTPVEIIPDFLFLSDALGASKLQRLKELKITHVLNVGGRFASRLVPEAYQEAGIVYKEIDARDDFAYPMLERHWEEACQFLQTVQETTTSDGRIVVHCAAGVNRSGLIVAAYYMIHEQQDVLRTVLHCRSCRGNVFLSSNYNFQRQLVALARYEGLLGPAPGEPGCIVTEPL